MRGASHQPVFMSSYLTISHTLIAYALGSFILITTLKLNGGCPARQESDSEFRTSTKKRLHGCRIPGQDRMIWRWAVNFGVNNNKSHSLLKFRCGGASWTLNPDKILVMHRKSLWKFRKFAPCMVCVVDPFFNIPIPSVITMNITWF